MADEEEWTLARRQEKIKEAHDPAETLIRSAKASRRDTTMAACATQVRTLFNEVVEGTRHVIDDQSTDYILFEVDKELQLLSKQGQQL
jgi:hypothetical protein